MGAIYCVSNNKAGNTDGDKKKGKQYTNSNKIKNDTPIRAFGRLERALDL